MVLYFVKILILVATLTAYDITTVCSFHHREKYAEIEAAEPLETILMKECENELDEMNCVKKLMNGVMNTQEMKNDEFINYMEKKKLHGSSKVIPVYHTGTTSFEQCNCDMEFQLMDLGKIYYPRYLKTGFCKQNSCAEFHKCIEKKYKVRVLKQRNMEDPDSNSLLPKSLREYWVSETIAVAVACECAPDI